MSFFNKKEEVMDIQLTRYGKRKLAQGKFQPKYYQFFDDDIIYNSEYAGFTEKQNDSEKRIFEDSPRLKKNVTSTGLGDEPILISDHEWDLMTDRAREYQKRYSPPPGAEKTLIYPLFNSESNTKEAPFFSLASYDLGLNTDEYSSEYPILSVDFSKIQNATLEQGTVSLNFSPNSGFTATEDSVIIFKDEIGKKIAFTFKADLKSTDTTVAVEFNSFISEMESISKNDIQTGLSAGKHTSPWQGPTIVYNVQYQYLAKHGVYKKIPQLSMDSDYTIIRYMGVENADTIRNNNSNNFIDLTSESIEFLDKSALHVTGSKIILSLEEANTHYNLSNFELEIYEINETTENTATGREAGPELKRVENIDVINKLFDIRSDEHVTEVKTPFGEKRNWYRSGE